MRELTKYRHLRECRDRLIRLAHERGHSIAKIAKAAGLTKRRVRQLTRGK